MVHVPSFWHILKLSPSGPLSTHVLVAVELRVKEFVKGSTAYLNNDALNRDWSGRWGRAHRIMRLRPEGHRAHLFVVSSLYNR